MPTKYATLEVRQKLQARVKDMEECKSNPNAWGHIGDKQAFLADEAKCKASLEAITPPDVAGAEKDRLRKRLSMLHEALVKGRDDLVGPMPSHRQNWDNGAGAPGRIIAWNNFWKRHTLTPEGRIVQCERGKGALWEAKDLMRVVNKEREVEDPDVANLEMIRPKDAADPLMDVPRRSYGLSPQAKENYAEAFPEHEPTPVEKKIEAAESERLLKEIEELKERLAESEGKKASKAAKSKAASERMKARWAARKQANVAEASQKNDLHAQGQ